MKLDVSVAPEIALLARTPAGETAPATIGHLAACLRLLAADPQTWWDLVRFDPHRPVRIPVTAPRPGCAAWLLVLPPGYRGGVEAAGYRDDAPEQEPGWEVACLVAGAMADQVSTPAGWRDRALTPGRTLVRGGAGPYRLANLGSGYAVSLHARSARPVPAPARPAPAPARPAPAPARPAPAPAA